MGSTSPPPPVPQEQIQASKYTFEIVPNVLKQSDPATDPSDFDNNATNFGLVDRRYPSDHATTSSSTDWQRFARYMHYLQSTSGPTTKYKVLYFGRHGEGYHNVAEAYYGTQAWDDYWSKLDGNGTVSWVDAHLTDIGKQQALAARQFIDDQLHPRAMPVPDHYYVSPMYRCLQTAQLTWTGLEFDLPAEKPFVPIIKEKLREVLGEHTCDKRSTKTVIHSAFPDFPIEEGFTEKDELWRADHRETHAEHDVRTKELLEEIFDTDDGMFISLTSHSGAIASFLRVLGHREFMLPTGGMMPVAVKARKVM